MMSGSASQSAAPAAGMPSRARSRRRWRWRRDGVTAALALGVAALLAWRGEPLWAVLFLASFGAAHQLVPPIALWVRMGLRAVAMPGGRGLHRRRVPLLGGVAIFAPTACLLLGLGLKGDARAWGLLAGATIVLLVGMRDDFKHVRPMTKVVAQLAAAACLILSGFSLPSIGVPGVGSLPLGVFGSRSCSSGSCSRRTP
jgi:UDP-N-acetylmuramyl pentapeptide phosphotransferase/UDP-N-acetylglucosamine-1-phosphate transferase